MKPVKVQLSIEGEFLKVALSPTAYILHDSRKVVTNVNVTEPALTQLKNIVREYFGGKIAS